MQTWQVGLDIQEHGFYAIAVQKRRYGWQLRHWHFQPIVSERLQTKIPVLLPEVIQLLRLWRKQMPKRVSVRIALPASSILQQSIPLPEKKLSYQEQSWLVDASLCKLFPLSAKELAIDYRVADFSAKEQEVTKTIVVSAARRSEIDEWIKALAEADIFPDVIDSSPCVLRFMAKSAGIDEGRLLFHQFSQQFLVVSPLDKSFFYRLIPNEAMCCTQRIEHALQIYQQIKNEKVTQVYGSGLCADDLPSNTDCWSPLTALQQFSAPLPDVPHQFVLACGLALREEDRHVSG